MLIAHVRFPIPSHARPTVVDAFSAIVSEVRAMKGCIAFYPFFDLSNDEVFGVVHEWESAEDFATYTASDAFKTFGAAVRPLMIGKPDSRRFQAQPLEAAN